MRGVREQRQRTGQYAGDPLDAHKEKVEGQSAQKRPVTEVFPLAMVVVVVAVAVVVAMFVTVVVMVTMFVAVGHAYSMLARCRRSGFIHRLAFSTTHIRTHNLFILHGAPGQFQSASCL